MDITDILETLAIEHLGQVKLDDLATKIEQATPEKINRPQALKVIMGWLHEQIKRDNIMQNGSLRDFVNLLRDSGTCPFTKEEVIQDFEKWQMKDAAEDPTNRRQYSIAKSELQLLFDQVPSRLVASNDSLPPQDFTEQHIHESRAALLQEPIIQEPFEDISNKGQQKDIAPSCQRKSGANVLPLGQRNTSLGSSKRETIGTNIEEGQASYLYTTPKKNILQQFPGGLDTFPDSGVDELTITQEAALQNSPERIPWSSDYSQGSESDEMRRFPSKYSPYRSDPIDLSHPPSSKYICKRCDRPGHWLQLCPTNLDPRWDRPPSPDYRCGICKKIGEHFATLCPRNKWPVSLTKQRELAGINEESSIQDENRRYRDRRSPSLAYERGRSVTPTRSSRYPGYDVYRPGSSSPNAMHEGFGRGSRADSPRFDSPPRARRSRRGTSHKENALIREDATDYNPSDRKTFFIRTGGGHGNNKAKRIDSVGMRADEGRLSYDDDIFIDSQQFLQTPKTKKTHKPDTDDQVSEEGEFVKVARSEPVLIPEEAEQAKRDTDRLLGELEAEILATLPSIKGTAPCGPSGVAMLDTHHNDAGHMDIDEGTCQSDADTGPAEVDLALIESPDGTRYRLVTETQFSPEIVALFRNRENPILNSKDNRKTASQM